MLTREGIMLSEKPQGVGAARTMEVTNYLPLPTFKSKEFWTPWKIQHIRRLSQTGRATDEPFLVPSERTGRALDRLYLKTCRPADGGAGRVRTSVPFIRGMEISSPIYLGDMSFGALSGVPNISIGRAADATNVVAGTGEGGLLDEVAGCSNITVQWASARFGVDISTLTRGLGVVIKIGQGAKPGIGGHLPGAKVTEPISRTRRIPVGMDAISPAPHHDIYSIEDLGQRILGLKEATGHPVFVKVAATNYIPYIASGIARMGADGIIIDGSGAGTGAAPAVVKNNCGIPIEFAVASADAILRREGLRENFTVVAAGRVSHPEDSLKLIAMGADITSLGTAALLSLGCLMVHKCHLGYCPAVLTNKITQRQARVLSIRQSVVWLTNLVNGWTEEMRLILEQMGLDDVRDLRGRRDLLEYEEGMNRETVSILGLAGSPTRSASGRVDLPMAGPARSALWPPGRITMLTEMAGTIGKAAAEATLSSMGNTSPPTVETPARLSDWLVVDGAQVTRPSIDPYREEIETSVYLGGTRLRLSSPFFFTHLQPGIKADVNDIFSRTALSMGLLMDCRGVGDVKHAARTIADVGSGQHSPVCSVDIGSYAAPPAAGSLVYLRTPSSREKVEEALGLLRSDGALAGVILDEDEEGSDFPLELSVARVDAELKRLGLRWRFDVLAEGNSVRGSDDIFKLMALGADCVGFGQAALIAMGYEEDREVVLDVKSAQRLENFVAATQREIKLLAGAAGASSVSSTITGNRELLRSVDLDPGVRKELGVKPAGGA